MNDDKIREVGCEYTTKVQYDFLGAVVQCFEEDKINIDKLLLWVLKTYDVGSSLILKQLSGYKSASAEIEEFRDKNKSQADVIKRMVKRSADESILHDSEKEDLLKQIESMKDAFNQLFESINSAKLSHRPQYAYQAHGRLAEFYESINQPKEGK
jgi:uncharacterized phage infection (PIP) family protein YhgE